MAALEFRAGDGKCAVCHQIAELIFLGSLFLRVSLHLWLLLADFFSCRILPARRDGCLQKKESSLMDEWFAIISTTAMRLFQQLKD